MRSGRFAAAAAVIAAAGCANQSADDPRIVFQSDQSGRWAMYSVRPDGTDLRRVDAYPGATYYVGTAYWSRGGERLLATREQTRGGDAVVIDTRHGTRRRVRVHAVGGLSWSPDADRIAVAAERGIVVIDADGANRRQLTYDPQDSDPSWSPDGKRIAFVSQGDLYTVGANGGIRHVLDVGGGDDVFASSWSHDGQWIAFSRGDYETGLAPLEVVRPDGSGRRQVARDAEQALWSPRGNTLVYVYAGDIFRVGVDGRNRQRLTFGGPNWGFEPMPSWSPDGKRIAYVNPRLAKGIRDPTTPADIWVMNADGSGKRPVTRAFPMGGTHVFPEWIEHGPKATAVQSPARLVALPGRSVLRTAQPAGGLAVRGSTAVAVQGLGSATEFENPPGPLLVWDAARRRVRLLPVLGCGTASTPMISANRVAYVCDNSAVDLYDTEIRVVSPGGLTRTIVHLRATHLVGARFTSRLLQGFAARDGVIAFGVGERPRATARGFRVGRTTIRRVGASGTRDVRTFDGDASVLDADATRIAVLHRGRVVVLDARGGTARRELAFRSNDVHDVELDGSRIVVLLRDRLVVDDFATGRRVSRPLPRDLGGSRHLAGIDGDLAAYVAGVAIHLVRLSDGRDVVIDLRTAAEPVYARLTPAGLFYTYTEPRRLPAGRLAFVPRPEVERTLARAG